MGNNDFEKVVKQTVVDYVNRAKGGEKKITQDDVYIVWSCKTLQNNKAMASAKDKHAMYYELTYNGDKNELYVDAYVKKENICIKNPAI